MTTLKLCSKINANDNCLQIMAKKNRCIECQTSINRQANVPRDRVEMLDRFTSNQRQQTSPEIGATQGQ